MSQPEVPQAVKGLLDWWRERIHQVLTRRLKNITLFGGVALGEFAPAWSDVDVCVVVEDEVTQADARQLTAVHDEMRERFVGKRDSGWPSRSAVEGFYVPAAVAAEQAAPGSSFLGFGHTRKLVKHDPLSPFDRLQLSRADKVWYGKPVRFGPPSLETLREQLNADLKYLRQPSKEQLDSALWNMDLIAWIARSLIFWRANRLLAKNAALRELIEQGHPFTDAFRLALTVRDGDAHTLIEMSLALRDALIAIAVPAAETLEQLAEV